METFEVGNEIYETFGSTPVYGFIFPKTLPISTYLYSCHAGPYTECDNPNKSFSIPMKLYCRKSIDKFFDNKEEWFYVAEKGVEFFEEFFS